MSADLLLPSPAMESHYRPPPSKKSKVGGEYCGLEKGGEGNGIELKASETSHGDGAAMAQNGNGVNGTEANGGGAKKGIDEGLYSRQLFVLGKEAMERMQNSSVLISGMKGLGVEIAKNVILSGVKSVTLHDTEQVSVADLGCQFFLREADIGTNRAAATLPRAAELNTYVAVRHESGDLTEQFVREHSVVVLTNSSLAEQKWVNGITHANRGAMIVADCRGLFAQVFTDFGPDFTVVDTTGETPITAIIAFISKEVEAL